MPCLALPAPAWPRCEALVASGAEVLAWDNREEARDAVAGEAEVARPARDRPQRL